MTGIEDLRQVARIARGEGWALDILIRRLACYRKTSGIANAARFSSFENSAEIVGRTPRSARVPLDPLFATVINLIQTGRPASGAVRGPGVRPTIFADRPVMRKTSALG